MDSERAAELFGKALEINDPAKRQGYLEGACGEDQELFDHIRNLLQQQTDAEGLFPTEPGDRTEFVPVTEGPGSVIGKYKILQEIGQGGMGVVYMAEQHEPFDKRVALKIIKLGMDTRAVVARFEAERQALALMNHPNIAKVLDAGATDTGRPYFVMELVKGVPITEYCDKQKLTTQERLELFIPVCQAIQHAHQKGIIHRDIKPSNVMVALFDGKPVPMVIDFGIAKATNQRLTEQTVFTNLGQFIGTPAYMSPEQAEGSQLDIDTRSDIYSLGVLLYELLTGSTPFPEKRLRSAGFKEMQRIIIEEDPPRPSTRFSTMTEDEQSKIGGTHGERPGRISLLLRRELDWIVMACLEKDRNRRYETANGLAADIDRYLKGDAPEKGPRTWSYQLSKLARKHKKTFAMAAVIVGILTVATVFSTIQWRRTDAAEREATKRADKLAASNGFWVDLIGQGNAYPNDPGEGARRGQEEKVNLKLVEAIRRASENISERFKDQPEIEGELRMTISQALSSLGYYDEAIEHLRRSHELLDASVGSTHTNTLKAKMELGWRIQWANPTKTMVEARTLMEEAHETALTEYGLNSPIELNLGDALGTFYSNRGMVDEAEQLLTRIAAVVGPPSAPSSKYSDAQRLNVARRLAGLRYRQGRDAESLRLHEDSLRAIEEMRHGTNYSTTDAMSLRYVAALLADWNPMDLKNPEQMLLKALRISRTNVGSASPTDDILYVLGQLQLQQRKYDEAIGYFQQCLDAELDSFQAWAVNTARDAANVPASLADWSKTVEELRRQRQELNMNDGTLLGLETLVTHLSGKTNEASSLQTLFFQNLRTNTAEGYAVDLSPMRAILSVPVPKDEIPLLEARVEETIRSQGKEPWWPNVSGTEVLRGMLAYRRDDLAGSIQLLEELVNRYGPNHITAGPMCLLAMAYRREDRWENATNTLGKADEFITSSLEPGTTGGYNRWEFFASALALRDEAETQIYGSPRRRPPLKDDLVEKRRVFEEVIDLDKRAAMQARLRNYPAARELYARLTNHPAFKVALSQNKDFIAYKVFTIYWALGDEDAHVEVLRRLHDGMATNESKSLYQLGEAPWPLPLDLEVRRRESKDRKRLEAEWADPEKRLGMPLGDTLALGMCLYREDRHGECLDVFKSLLTSSKLGAQTNAKTFSAMAHWKLKTKEHQEEARRLLKEADERFFKTVIEPGEGMFPPYFPACIMQEQIIKEADQLIDPGVDNAPHVAALPVEGWTR